MPDRLFAEPRLAALYDAMCAGRPDFAFYLPLVMGARAVLDVGCGTGQLLHLARESGHRGRLAGLDPAPGMLEQARKRSDIDWYEGDLATVPFDAAFDLIVMTGHAFQVLLTDAALRAALAAIRKALLPGGRFVFETRNPLVREWERWTAGRARAVEGVQVSRAVENVDGELVSFGHSFSGEGWTEQSRSTLRFIAVESLDGFLCEAGLGIEARFGDWDESPFTPASVEIITKTRKQ